MNKKYYTYQDMVVLNDEGRQCYILRDEIIPSCSAIFAPSQMLAANYMSGTIDIMEGERHFETGVIDNAKRIGTLCNIHELSEITEEKARGVIESRINTISAFLSLIPNPKELNNETALRDALCSAGSALCTHSRDHSLHRKDAWVYGILLGWGGDSLAEVAAKHNWDSATVDRLRKLRAAVAQAGGER